MKSRTAVVHAVGRREIGLLRDPGAELSLPGRGKKNYILYLYCEDNGWCSGQRNKMKKKYFPPGNK